MAGAAAVAGCRRLSGVSRESGALFRKSKRFSPEGSEKQQKHFEIPYLFSVFEKIKLPQGRKNVVKYVVPYRCRRKSVVEYVVPYRWRCASVVKHVALYRWGR